jgi:hypothetical protein
MTRGSVFESSFTGGAIAGRGVLLVPSPEAPGVAGRASFLVSSAAGAPVFVFSPVGIASVGFWGLAMAFGASAAIDDFVGAPLSGVPASFPSPCEMNGITGFADVLALARTVSSPIDRPSISADRFRITGAFAGADGVIGEAAFAGGSPGELGDG